MGLWIRVEPTEGQVGCSGKTGTLSFVLHRWKKSLAGVRMCLCSAV